MTTKNFNFCYFLFLALVPLFAGYAQDDAFDRATDPGLAKEKYALLSDNLMFENYAAAKAPANWLLQNAAAVNENIYIKAIKVYDELQEKETDPTRKARLQDSLLLIYDLRLQNGFFDSSSYFRYKGYKLYPFQIQRSTKENVYQMYAFYRQAFLHKPSESTRSHLTYLAALMCKSDQPADTLMNLYTQMEDVMDYQIENEKPSEQKKWITAKESIDKIVLSCLEVDCNFVEQKLCPQLEEKRDDMALVKKLVKFSISAKCTDSPCYFAALEALADLEPTCGLTRKLGQMYFERGDIEKGMAAFRKAAEEACASTEEQAEAYYLLAEALSKKGRLQEARTYALKAAAKGEANGYNLIGNLYMGSFSSCGEASAEVKRNPVKTQAVYLAAYEMFEKAGNRDGMNRAAARFPTAEQIFTQGLREGDQVSIDHCWIGGSYAIRRRP
ncbi:MAG: hypothetical protein ACFCUI_05415 [Bernardetiaceae bacterium]